MFVPRPLLHLLFAALLAGPALPPSASAACEGCTSYAAGVSWGTANAPALVELSGLAASRRNLDVLWTHNDGSRDRLYALSANGTLLATWRLNQTVDDLEDLAIGPGPIPGVTYLYVGDIGGNVGSGQTRSEVRIFRIPEPAVSSAWAGNPVGADFEGVQSFTLAYPDGSYDAESLMVDPVTGDVLIATKQPETSRIYRVALPATAAQGTLPLTYLCDASFERASAGDISPDGTLIVLRDETQATLWQRCDNEPLATALTRAGLPVPIVGPPDEPNGEGLAFLPDRSGYVTTGEGSNPGLFFCQALCPAAPRFTVAPADQTAFVGGTATFSARASGHPAPAWQWHFAGQALAGETTPTLTLANLGAAQAGLYQVVVANALGTATNQASLTVHAKPDLRITEVMSSPTTGSGRADWWELTSLEAQTISLGGWRFNDSNGGLGDPFTLPAGLIIGAGESIVFVEGLTPAQFRSWWGATNLPAQLQIVTYSSSGGFGLSASGDGLRLWTDTATTAADTVASVDFGVAQAGVSFGYDYNSAVFGTNSVVGIGGAFRAATSTDVGSPGFVRAPATAPELHAMLASGKLRIEFATEPQRLYRLHARARLDAPWAPTGDSIRSTNSLTGAFETVIPDRERYFRVSVE